jgi:two-component system NtrC family sensor kinase
MADTPRPALQMHHVLVVDDDFQLAEELAAMLTFENCTVEIANNGMEALDHLQGQVFDAIICDLMMPRMDGETLYRETAERYPFLAEKFVFITGQAARQHGSGNFVARTGCPLLEKPFTIDQLRVVLQEVF